MQNGQLWVGWYLNKHGGLNFLLRCSYVVKYLNHIATFYARILLLLKLRLTIKLTVTCNNTLFMVVLLSFRPGQGTLQRSFCLANSLTIVLACMTRLPARTKKNKKKNRRVRNGTIRKARAIGAGPGAHRESALRLVWRPKSRKSSYFSVNFIFDFHSWVCAVGNPYNYIIRRVCCHRL